MDFFSKASIQEGNEEFLKFLIHEISNILTKASSRSMSTEEDTVSIHKNKKRQKRTNNK